MKIAAVLVVMFILAPAAWAHHVKPADVGVLTMSYPPPLFSVSTVEVYPFVGEHCLVTADVVEERRKITWPCRATPDSVIDAFRVRRRVDGTRWFLLH